MSVETRARARGEGAFARAVRSVSGTQDPRTRRASAGVGAASALRGGPSAGGRGAPGRARRAASAPGPRPSAAPCRPPAPRAPALRTLTLRGPSSALGAPAPDALLCLGRLQHPRPCPSPAQPCGAPVLGGRPDAPTISRWPWHARVTLRPPGSVSARAATSRRSRPDPGPGFTSGLAAPVLTVGSDPVGTRVWGLRPRVPRGSGR